MWKSVARVIVSVIYVLVVLLVVWWAKSRDDTKEKEMRKAEASPYVRHCFDFIQFVERLPEPIQKEGELFVSEHCIGIWINNVRFGVSVKTYLDHKDSSNPVWRKGAEMAFNEFLEEFLGSYDNLAAYRSLGLGVRLYTPDDDDSAILYRFVSVPNESFVSGHPIEIYTSAIQRRYRRERGKNLQVSSLLLKW